MDGLIMALEWTDEIVRKEALLQFSRLTDAQHTVAERNPRFVAIVDRLKAEITEEQRLIPFEQFCETVIRPAVLNG